MLRRVRDHGDREALPVEVEDRETDAVDGDRSLLHAVAHEATGDPDPEFGGSTEHLADAVDMTLNDVSGETVLKPDGTLEVDSVADTPVPQGGPSSCLRRDVGLEPVRAVSDDREARAVHRDRVTDLDVTHDARGRDPVAAVFDALKPSLLLDDP